MRQHYLFTGRTRGHAYALKITPAGADSYECELTTSYPTDQTISGQWLRRYPADFRGREGWRAADAIRRDLLRYCQP